MREREREIERQESALKLASGEEASRRSDFLLRESKQAAGILWCPYLSRGFMAMCCGDNCDCD